MKQKLADIASQCGRTSKPSIYLNLYESIFEELRHENLNILEIGVENLGSLKLWHGYFAHSKIIGLDIQKIEAKEYESFERIRIYQGDQSDPEILKKIINENGLLDIVIDDAAHIGKLSRISFDILFPFVKDGGYYIVEDWGTGYWEGWPDGDAFRPKHYSGMVGFIKDLVDEVASQDHRPPRASQIDSMTILFGQVVVKKKSCN